MKLTVDRGELHAALTQTIRIVEHKSTIQIARHVRLDAGLEQLLVTGTDCALEARIKVAADIDEPGSTTVNAALLSAFVTKLPAGRVTLERSADGSTIRVGIGRVAAKFPVLPAEDFPILEAGERPHVFALAGPQLAEALGAVRMAISTDETRIYMNGAYLHAAVDEDGRRRICVVATDGHRLSRWRAPLPDGAEALEGIIIPTKTVDEIRKIATEGAKAGHDQVVVSASDRIIRFEVGPTILTSLLIDGSYPDYARIIPAGRTSTAIVDAKEIAAAVDRVSVVLAERSNGIAFTFAPDAALSITARNVDNGTITEEVAMSQGPGEPPDLTIGFNGRYFSGAIEALGAETVEIRLPADPGSPTVFVPTTQGDRDRLVVMMPLRV